MGRAKTRRALKVKRIKKTLVQIDVPQLCSTSNVRRARKELHCTWHVDCGRRKHICAGIVRIDTTTTQLQLALEHSVQRSVRVLKSCLPCAPGSHGAGAQLASQRGRASFPNYITSNPICWMREYEIACAACKLEMRKRESERSTKTWRRRRRRAAKDLAVATQSSIIFRACATHAYDK